MDRNVLSGGLLGLGVAAFVDETVFHQLLHWHHFYDKSTAAAVSPRVRPLMPLRFRM